MSKAFPKRKAMFPTGKVALGGFAFVLLLFFFPGCGDTPEKYMRDNIDLINEMADIFETIDSKDAAKAALPRLAELKTRSKAIEERGEALKINELPREKLRSLDEQFQQDLKKAQ